MKNNKFNKKIISALAVFAISATTVCSAAAFAGCVTSESPEKKADKTAATTKISTAVGEITSRSSGTTYYVSTTGVSTNDGLSADKPKDVSSLLNALDILKPGDTVFVAPGTYKFGSEERISLYVSGEYNKYITIKNASDTEPCIFDFSEHAFASTNRGVSFYGNYIHWYGIDVCGAGDNGLYIGGSYNTVEYCEFYNNRDTGLQLGRSYSEYAAIDTWPSYNLVKNCTSHNNYDNETYGENADGFAAKLTVGYGNVFDGCIAYRNSDDGWDLYAKTDSGNIGTVIMYNCVAYENGYLEYTQAENNARLNFNKNYEEAVTNSYLTRDGDGNGFKLGGSTMEGDVLMYNCLSFNNRMHGVTDNSNPGVISVKGVTSYNNGAGIDNTPSSSNFGYIRDVANSAHANIDLARQTYSYNNISRVLSVGDSYNNSASKSSNLSSDELRGSSIDSVLVTVKDGAYTHYALEGAYDVQSKTDGSKISDFGESIDLSSSAIFKKLPFTKSGSTYTRNITGYRDLYSDNNANGGLNPARAHIKYRNDEGSINMGDILAKKSDANASLISGKDIGSTLNKSSYGAYEHFYVKDFVDDKANSTDAATVKRAAETLEQTLTCDPDAVYQDFDLVNKMLGVSIKWESSDENVLVIDDSNVQVSVSKSEYIKAVIYRDPEEDKPVTITAYLTCGTASETVSIDLTVKQGTPTIGKIFATTQSGDVINHGGNCIVDQYVIYREPAISVENGIDYNGKLLSKDQYTVTTSYTYKTSKKDNASIVKGYTPSKAGVYTVTHTVTLKDTGEVGKMIYTIYVVSPYSTVEFDGDASVTVNRYGYVLSGSVTNPAGYIYAVSSPTQLVIGKDITKDNIKTYTGVKSYAFRADTISFQFENANSGSYYIYYALTNMTGEVTTKVYETKISVQNISSESEFNNLFKTDTNTSTIYLLTKDLDFSSKSWSKPSGNTFRALFNGNGHTITGITSTDYVFYKVGGGTIMNVKFENTNVTSGKTKVGLISECTGGYFYNVQLNGINVYTSDSRAAGLIGQVAPGSLVSIDQVALDNSGYSSYSIGAKGTRVGGLIAMSQSSGGASLNIEISNSWVNAYVYGDSTVGGFFGEYDCGNNSSTKYNLTITNCVFTGIAESKNDSKSYAAGIVAYQKGAYSNMTITNCISIGEVKFHGESLTASLKNASMIVGCSTTTLAEGVEATVDKCYATLEEYDSSYSVAVWSFYNIINPRSYTEVVGLDTDKWELVYAANSTTILAAPYVTLKFLSL